MIFLPFPGVSYNRPKLSACATWNSNAVTFADNNTMIQTASAVFLTANNTVYATSFALDSVLVWTEGSPNVTRRLFGNLSASHRVFVTTDGTVYADDTLYHSRIMKWTVNETIGTVFMNITAFCGGIFVDIYDFFYCAHSPSNQVLKKPVDGDNNSSVIVAGNGIAGSAPHMLNGPYGIFVDLDLSLYVTDFTNNRVQLFRPGQVNATTLAGNGAPDTIALYYPIAIILDADGYLFIAEYGNHRIVRSGPNGFRCIVACTGTTGAAANQLYQPRALSFDSYGNLYVADETNNRIQTFSLVKNDCGKFLRPRFCLHSSTKKLRSFTFVTMREDYALRRREDQRHHLRLASVS